MEIFAIKSGIYLTHIHEFTYLYFPGIIFFLFPFSLAVSMAKRGFIALALIKTFDRIELDPVQLDWDNIEFRTVRLDPFECNTSSSVSAINTSVWQSQRGVTGRPPPPGRPPLPGSRGGRPKAAKLCRGRVPGFPGSCWGHWARAPWDKQEKGVFLLLKAAFNELALLKEPAAAGSPLPPGSALQAVGCPGDQHPFFTHISP